MPWGVLGLAVLSILPLPQCSRAPDRDAEIKAVAKVIDDNMAWFQNKNFELLFSTMTNGPDLFMFQLDTQSTIDGFKELKTYSAGWRNPDVKYAGHKFQDLRIHLSRAGDSAWFSTRLEDCASVKNRPARCFTTRYTGVLEKRDGRWLIVQQHFSLPAEKIAADWAAKTAHAPGQD